MPIQNRVKLVCADCKSTNYFTPKNKKGVERKFEFKKHCTRCRKHTTHKEGKK